MSKDVLDTLIAEAGSDPDGLAAVAWVIQNRAQQWGLTPEQVVKQKGQFEGYYNPGPKSREAQKRADVRAKAEAAWNAVQAGTIPDPTNGGTSFRTKGYKQPAPNGTVTIAGNTFALGSAKPNSAISAINAAAPQPMPSRPTALAYAPSASVPRPPSGSYTLPPPALDLNPPLPPRASSWQEKGGPVMRGDIPLPRPRPTPPAPARGVGTSYLAPATEVKTVKIDPLTGNPVTEQATAPRPVSKPPRVTFVPRTSTPTPFQTANRTMVQSLPLVGPIATGVATASTLAGNLINRGTAAASPQPQPTTLPSVIPNPPKTNTPPRSVPKADTSIPAFIQQFGKQTPPPAPLPPKPPKTAERLPAGDAGKAAFVQTYYPNMYSAEAIKRGQDIADALYPRPASPKPITPAMPRMPMNPTAAMMAARAPRVQQPVQQAAVPRPRPRPIIAQPQQAQRPTTGGLLGLLFGSNTSSGPISVPGGNPNITYTDRGIVNPGSGKEINGIDIAFMPKAVQQSSRWNTGY